MNLTEDPEFVTWPETHYLHVEKIGPFQETARQAWGQVHAQVPVILERNEITGYMSLYKIEPEMVYRAGVALGDAPVSLPEGMEYTKFAGGRYARFVLTGSYMNLPEACGRVFEIIEEKKIPARDDFYIENYTNDPRTTPEEELVTHILVPTV